MVGTLATGQRLELGLRLELSDRRRLVVAIAITVIALPSLWLMSRSGDSGAPNVATAGVALDADAEAPAAAPVTSQPEAPVASAPATVVDPMGSLPGAYLRPPASTPAPGPVAIAVPSGADATSAVGDASYRSSIDDRSACIVRGAPFGALVTVTNRNNNRSVTCRASVPPTGTGDDVVLATSAFATIADLTDAPVPVDIDW